MIYHCFHFPMNLREPAKIRSTYSKKLSAWKYKTLDNMKMKGLSQLALNDFHLLFKLHGRHANILLFKGGEVVSIFKQNMAKDHEIQLNQLDRPIDQSDENILKSAFDLKVLYPTFDKHIKNRLKSDGFYAVSEPENKLRILKQLISELEGGYQYITDSEGDPQLRLFKPSQFMESFDDPIKASNAYARLYFKNSGFNGLKANLLGQVSKELKKSESYLNHTRSKLAEIMNRRGYDEIANILMANLHQTVSNGSKTIELTDFYTNKPITIKLKSNLSLQQNAELLYRKAKNQGKEIDVLKQNIEAKEKARKALEYRQSLIEQIEDIRELKKFDQKARQNNSNKEELPFMLFNIEGYQVYVGKNAKNNDLLTQKFAKKDDLWLHARDVSGSHVIIRNPNGLAIPIPVVEQVAQIAAWYSKRKSDSLCPVIFTPKKFVRKPKGSLPGQVVLSQEKVIMVKPSRPK